MKRLITVCLLGMFLILSCLASVAACPTDAKCPVHDYAMAYTGEYKTVNGHGFGLYRCPSGDEYWVRCD